MRRWRGHARGAGSARFRRSHPGPSSKAHGEARGWPPKWVTSVNLALDEPLSNVISYGYRDSDEHEVLVTLSERDGALEVEVVLEDEGVAFDPFTDAPEPDLESSLEVREIKGLGVHFVKSFMDEVAYERRDGRNYTKLLLRAPETGAPPGRPLPASPVHRAHTRSARIPKRFGLSSGSPSGTCGSPRSTRSAWTPLSHRRGQAA